MGKATKWIINFLLGKREDKCKKRGPSVSPVTCILRTPNARGRWSFERSVGSKPVTHKTSRSLDSIPTETILQYHTRLNNAVPWLLNLHAAATKIQAVYRSYLARRALQALRGLVKLQALARGHLVRKQMNTVLRSMHAVMAIQVRARIHRIQMTEQPAVMVRRRTSCSKGSDRHLRKQENIADWNTFPNAGVSRSRSAHMDSERAYQQLRASSMLMSLTGTSPTAYDGHLEESSSEMEPKCFRKHSADLENKLHPWMLHQPQQCRSYMPTAFKFTPTNYMNVTESSKAKSRSPSEPRRRHEPGIKQKSRRSSSMDGKNDPKNKYPWLI